MLDGSHARQHTHDMESLDRQLRYFVRIAETKSLSRAADGLDLTQSAISRQLASLEAYVGNALFVRTGRGVELTDCGRRLLAAAKPAYAAIDEALEDIREREGLSRGTIRVATVHTLSYYFTADVLAQFVGRHEQVNLSLMGRSSPDVVALVESGRADLGFVYDVAVNSADLAATPLFDDEMCLIAPKSHRLPVPVRILPLGVTEQALADPGPALEGEAEAVALHQVRPDPQHGRGKRRHPAVRQRSAMSLTGTVSRSTRSVSANRWSSKLSSVSVNAPRSAA